MNVMRPVMGLILLLSASAAIGAERCEPVIEAAWVRAAPPGAASLAGYLVLRTVSDAPVTVTGVDAADFAMPMIHRTVEEGGVSKMRHVDRNVVPAGGELRFEPGGLHLMLMHPQRALAEGDVVRIGLVLADGRTVATGFPVRREAPAPAPAAR